MQKNPEKILKPRKISMVFFEGVDVRHPLTVINSKFSQPFFHEKKDIKQAIQICQHLNVWNGM